MADALARVWSQGPGVFASLGRAQQVLLLALAVLVPSLMFVGSQWVSDGQYVPLFASLTTEDAGAIVTQLKSAKVPYRLGGNGEQILVPADRANEMRLKMAVQGLPLGGGVGFEVFDRPALGVSDFAQRLNYQRALQGELSRTIGQLRGVTRARVHLVLPQPSLFTDRERPASASVFLKLTAGTALGREEIRGIVHLVASSVEGLNADRVTIVDTAGRVLSVGADGAAATGPVSGRRLELKTAVEDGVEQRLQSLLDAVLGPRQAVSRVSAHLNFDQVERTEEKFDPNTIARQKTRSQESTKAGSSAPVPGATPATDLNVTASATPGPSATASTTQTEATRQSETTTYEMSRIVARTLTSPGEIQRLSVAVLLNTPTKVVMGDDKKETRQPAARAPEEIEKIRKVVMGAIGFNESRGDEVTVVEMPFDTTVLDRERAVLDGPAPPPAPRQWLTSPSTVMMAIGGAAAVAMAVVVWLTMVRGRAQARALAEVSLSVSQDAERVARGGAASATPTAAKHVPRVAQPLVPEELLELSRERDDIRQKAFSLATAEPEATAQLIRAWLVKKKAQPVGHGVGDGA